MFGHYCCCLLIVDGIKTIPISLEIKGVKNLVCKQYGDLAKKLLPVM